MPDQTTVPDDNEPTLADAVDELINDRIDERVHTCKPGYITKYDKDKREAEIQIVVRYKRVAEGGEVINQKYAILTNVPVQLPETDAFFLSYPVKVGNFVWVHFVDQSLDAWLTLGGTDRDDPLLRRFSFNDCFATLGRDPTKSNTQTRDDAIVIGGKGNSDARAYFRAGEIALGSEHPSSYVALATQVHTALEAIKATLSGGITTVSGGAGTFSVPLIINTNVAATKVKAE